MKTFTHPQKKWVLTGALLAVLGFNVSFNSHENGIASADFASTVEEGVVQGKIYTAKGVVPVKYIDNGEDKVLAIVPKKMTEGKVCETCGYESINLTVKNKKDIDALNVELVKVMSQTKNTVASDTVAEGQQGDEKIKKDFFASIEKCDSKKSNADILACRTDKFIRILKSNGKDIEKEAAFDYYKENIETLIAGEIVESRRIVNRQRRSSVMAGQWYTFQDSDDSMKSPSEMRNNALDKIRELISGVPSKFEDIRKRLITAETEMVKAEAQELQQTFVQARDSKDPALGNYLFQEGQLRRNDLTSLMRDMLDSTHSGLDAVRSGDMNASLKNQYMDYFNQFMQRMYNGMNTDVYNFTGAGNGNTTLPGVNLDSRLQNPGRNSGTVLPNGAISSRTGATLTPGAATQTILVPIQVPVTGNGASQLTIPTENNGVQFGTMVPASPEALRMRAQIRGQ